jgi:hypothetical protein
MSETTDGITETKYVKILRQKLGEFMLTMIDLHQRGVKHNSCVGEQDCIESLIDAIELEGENKSKGHIGHQFNKGQDHMFFYKRMKRSVDNLTKEQYDLLKQFTILIINSEKYNSTIEERLLNVLLVNNGFPCQFMVYRYDTNPELINTTNQLYKMYMINGDSYGLHLKSNGQGVKPNHYTVKIPEELLKTKYDEYTVVKKIQTNYKNRNDKQIQIKGDGNCFYTAVAVWCKIYGITEEHLNSITYNVPFGFSEEHSKSNLKVPNPTDDNSIPKPIELPKDGNDTYGFKKFIETDAPTIAQNMINKIKETTFKPQFNGENKTITESKEYKDYTETEGKGVNKDTKTHCNKYKGNKNPNP